LNSDELGVDLLGRGQSISDLINSIPQELGFLAARTLYCKEKKCVLLIDISSQEAFDTFQSKASVDVRGISILFTVEDRKLA
jgi:hypothetical protein